MSSTFQDLISYFKNPVLEKDSNTSLTYRFRVFFKILLICFLTSFFITPIYTLLDELQFISMDEHKVKQMLSGMSKFQILLSGAVIAPVIEELIFRAPITAFKHPANFKRAFYAFALAFGLLHILNFNLTTNVLLFAPLLVLPQIILGGYFGYIRVKFGLQWSILLHAMYNGVLFLIGFLFK
jgi:hypothetical protein